MGLGRAGIALTERETYTRALVDAAQLARSQGWAVRQARAVIQVGVIQAVDERWGEEIRRLIDEALAVLPPGDSPERAMLLARRAWQSLAPVRAPGEVEADIDEALAIARRLGGPEELAFALQAKWFWLMGTPQMVQQEHVVQERVVGADAVGGLEVRDFARRGPVVAALVRGQREAFEGRLQEFRGFADSSRGAYARYFALCCDSLLAFVEGRFEEAKRLAAAARDATSRNPGLALSYNELVTRTRLEEGREAEVIPVSRALRRHRASLARHPSRGSGERVRRGRPRARGTRRAGAARSSFPRSDSAQLGFPARSAAPRRGVRTARRSRSCAAARAARRAVQRFLSGSLSRQCGRSCGRPGVRAAGGDPRPPR